MNRLGARRLFYRNPFTILGKRNHREDLSGSGFLGRAGARGWGWGGWLGARQAVFTADPGARVFLAPDDASALELLLCGRVGAVTVPEGGEVVLTAPSGRGWVAVEGEARDKKSDPSRCQGRLADDCQQVVMPPDEPACRQPTQAQRAP